MMKVTYMLRRIGSMFRFVGAPLMSLSIGAFCLMSAFAASTSPANAQSQVPGMILSFEDCLLQQRKLREEAKTFGDRAWEKFKALAGAVFTSPEIRALYARADELRNLADQMHCVWQPGSRDASKESKEIDKAVQALAQGALNNYPKEIRERIQKQLKQIQDHNSFLMARLNDMKNFRVPNSRGQDPEGEAQPPEMVRRQIDEDNARARRQPQSSSPRPSQCVHSPNAAYPCWYTGGQSPCCCVAEPGTCSGR